jgi:hypothetical protein
MKIILTYDLHFFLTKERRGLFLNQQVGLLKEGVI